MLVDREDYRSDKSSGNTGVYGKQRRALPHLYFGLPEDRLQGMESSNSKCICWRIQLTSTSYFEQAFLPSTRNADEAQLHLLKVTECSKFLFSEERGERVREIQGLCPGLEIYQVPSLKTTLGDESGLRHYPFTASYEELEDEIACIIHSSGTTGKSCPPSSLWTSTDPIL